LDCRPTVARLALPAGAVPLEERADALLKRLGIASETLRALEAEAKLMVSQAESALRAALTLLEEQGDRIGQSQSALNRYPTPGSVISTSG
jgi:hypothetical protein